MQLLRALVLICMVGWPSAWADGPGGMAEDDPPGPVCLEPVPRIEVTVSGHHPSGLLTVELYRPSQSDFLRKASRIERIRVPAGEPPQTVCFALATAGRYALAAYHDVDGDRKLDRKWNRLPDEPFALSNNKKLRLRMPDFEDAAFTAGDGVTRVDLKLRK